MDIEISEKDLELIEFKIKRFEYGITPGSVLVEKLYAAYRHQQSIIDQQKEEIERLNKENVEWKRIYDRLILDANRN